MLIKMTKCSLLLILCVLSFLSASHACGDPSFAEQALWKSGADGYHTYRIPALIVTPNGSVLAFCEGRKTGSGDHGDVDLIMKRSTDGARTWSSQSLVYEEGDNAKITIGNPCPVVDMGSGRIWLTFTRDNLAVFITSSSDDGLTWSEPRNISANAMKDDWDWVATGPGIGIQLTRGPHKGRLVIPCDHKFGSKSVQPQLNSHMMYSDDSGQTWRISSPIGVGGNECQVIERADSSLLVNTRMQGNFRGLRGTSTSSDGGFSWSTISQEKQLPCPKCQASFIRINAQEILFSNPNPGVPFDGNTKGKRVNLTVRLSRDDGTTWPVEKLIHKGPSAYSCLAQLNDGTILCLFETGLKNSYESLYLARFNLDWLTNHN